jgi:hypothetical protein
MPDADSSNANAGEQSESEEEVGHDEVDESAEDSDMQIEESDQTGEDENVTMGAIAKSKVTDALKRQKRLVMQKIPFVTTVALIKN